MDLAGNRVSDVAFPNTSGCLVCTTIVWDFTDKIMGTIGQIDVYQAVLITSTSLYNHGHGEYYACKLTLTNMLINMIIIKNKSTNIANLSKHAIRILGMQTCHGILELKRKLWPKSGS
jgi:hypothetical protein